MKKNELELKMEGGYGISFHANSYCGKAKDSIAILYECRQTCAVTHGWSPGGVLTRKDAKKLRDFLNEALSKRARPSNLLKE